MRRSAAGLALAVVAAGAAAEVVPEVLRGVEARAAALLLSGQRGGAIEGAVVAGPVMAAEDGACRVDLWLEADGTTLLAGQHSGISDVEVVTYALADAGGVVAFDRVLLRLDADLLGERLRRHGLRVHRRLGELPCARHTLRVLLLHRGRGDFFLGEAQAEVAGEGWLAFVLANRGEGVEVGGEESSGSLAPAARPVAWPGRTLSVALFPPGGTRPEGEIRGRLAGGEAMPLTRLPAPEVGGAMLLEWPVPGGAPGGPAILEVLASGDGGEEVVVRVPVRVVGREGAASVAPSAEPLPPAGELRAAFLAVLRQLARGGREQALQAAEALQRRALGEGGGARQERFASAVLGVAREVAGEQGAALVPLLWLHHELFHEFASNADHLRATVAAGQLAALASLCDGRHCGGEVRLAAGQALAGLGEAHARQAAWHQARRYFQRALELAPELEAARLGAAAVAEWLGEYGEAVTVLRPAGSSPKVDGELLLRLGVNLRRLGETRRAAAALRRCADQPGPEWVRVLALEELAQLELAAGRPAAAVALLAPAVAAFPFFPSLRLLLAQAHEEGGEAATARALLAEPAAAPAGSGESPRLHYTRRSARAIGAHREELRAACERAQPALAAALASLTGAR